MGKSSWDKIRRQPVTESAKNRDVYDAQQFDRSKVGTKQTFTSRHLIAIGVGLLLALIVWVT